MLYPYECANKHQFELRSSMADKPASPPCPECGVETSRPLILGAPALITTIIPSYPGSKKRAAGYVHSHGDRAATKVISGPYGCLNPSTKPVDPIVEGVMPEVLHTPQKRLAS
jgi:hypothetical protein